VPDVPTGISDVFARIDASAVVDILIVSLSIYWMLLLVRGTTAPKPPRREAEPATSEQYEQLFGAAQAALDSIEFFKARNPEHIIRTIREVAHRTPIDAREAKLFIAMCYEVTNYLRRQGME